METYDKMSIAFQEARRAINAKETPVGAALYYQDRLIASAHNQCHGSHDPLLHAEMLVLGSAFSSLQSISLSECCLYVTLEPCAMCAAAIAHARLGSLVFAAFDTQLGACGSSMQLLGGCLGWTAQMIGGYRKEESERLLAAHFSELRHGRNHASSTQK